ncbi:MAG: NAD(P)-dependent oxidoreductase [Rhodothermaceae bacterium]|nr:NAD(P)-dependent oxidoreductase [Rhodothermaceae bacterium]
MQIKTEPQLLDLLTRPSEALVAFMATLQGPLVILGAGGKMGPTLCVRAKRAAEQASNPIPIIAVSRFSDKGQKAWLESKGVQTHSCDLMDRDSLRNFPDAEHVIYLVGMKFGTQSNPALTWAVNALIPDYMCERYPNARIVALSTGNVYTMTEVEGGGSVESDPLEPLGEYANACVARERVFEYKSQQLGTAIVSIRLNYAIDLRYGVLVDLAQKIIAGKPVDLTMGYFNCIWQGDANDMILRALPLATSPARALNVTGKETLSVRKTALALGRLMNKPVSFSGTESTIALLNNSAVAHDELGPPSVGIEEMLEWTARWIQDGNQLLNKPTHFETRDGKY